MTNKPIIFLFLVIFWLILSGRQEPFFLVSGFISCLIAYVVAVRLKLHNKLQVNGGAFWYNFWLAKEMAISSMLVTRKIWARKLKLDPEFVVIDLEKEKDIFYTIYANSITMTPGTVTVLVEEKKKRITAHALEKASEEDLKGGVMRARIKRIITE